MVPGDEKIDIMKLLKPISDSIEKNLERKRKETRR